MVSLDYEKQNFVSTRCILMKATMLTLITAVTSMSNMAIPANKLIWFTIEHHINP